MRWLLAMLLLAVGCAAPALEHTDDMAEKPRWCAEERPAHVVVSDALKADCQLAVEQAVAWWAARGADYLTFAVEPDQQLLWGKPVPLLIQVTSDFPEDPAASGDTRIMRITPECIQAAEIRFDPFWCNPKSNTAKHELGHALGLAHIKDPHNLMYPDGGSDARDNLTPAQLEQVK